MERQSEYEVESTDLVIAGVGYLGRSQNGDENL